MLTMLPTILAFVTWSLGFTETTCSGLPSGSESLASTWTETVTPGRTVTASRVAIGFGAPPGFAAMPTRTVPVARAPSASMTP